MVKTTTLSTQESTAPAAKRIKKINVKASQTGPSDFTIQNILNYSKALQVIGLTQTQSVYGVMN